MQAKIISTTRTNTTSEHASDPEQSGVERKLEMRIRLEDMPSIPNNRFYRGTSPGWVPELVSITETMATGYGDDSTLHFRQIAVYGHLLKKDGSLGKLASDDYWRTYGRDNDLADFPAALQEVLAQVVPAFDKGIMP